MRGGDGGLGIGDCGLGIGKQETCRWVPCPRPVGMSSSATASCPRRRGHGACQSQLGVSVAHARPTLTPRPASGRRDAVRAGRAAAVGRGDGRYELALDPGLLGRRGLETGRRPLSAFGPAAGRGGPVGLFGPGPGSSPGPSGRAGGTSRPAAMDRRLQRVDDGRSRPGRRRPLGPPCATWPACTAAIAK
jgi:hypothetical protein